MIRKLSIQSLIILSALFLFGSMIIAAYVSEQNNIASIKEREEEFLREIIAISVNQVYEELNKNIATFATKYIERKDFQQAFETYASSGSIEQLNTVLTDPFVSGYVNASVITIESLRVFDRNWQFVAEGQTKGIMSVDAHAFGAKPNVVIEKAILRKGNEQLRTISGRWSSNQGAFYSVIFPIGGLRLKGYLEVVVNANMNLPAIEKMLSHNIGITNLATNEEIFASHLDTGMPFNSHEVQEIHYEIHTLDQKHIYTITAFVPHDEFLAKIKVNRNISIVFGVFLNIAILTSVLMVIEILLVRPMKRFRQDIHRETKTLSGKPILTSGLREFHQLAKDFNHLIHVAKTNNDMLEKMSLIDSLTQLPNRRALDEFIKTTTQHALRTQEPVSVLMMDIDYFKKYNDAYGHKAGDECLKQVAEAIKQALPRATDFVGRYGGEEFTAILPHTDLEGSKIVAKHIIDSVCMMQLPHKSSEAANVVTLSLGIASCSRMKSDCSEWLILQADKNLYEAKRQGRNCFFGGDNGDAPE